MGTGDTGVVLLFSWVIAYWLYLKLSPEAILTP